MYLFRTSLLVTFLLVGLSPAWALQEPTGECSADADCPAGQACEVVGGTSSSCAAGAEDCEPQTTEVFGCVPASCDSNSDCSGDTVCIMIEMGCEDVPVASVPCRPGEECDPPPAPEPCEPEMQGRCGPKWLAPCETASDCGAGFNCEPETVEVCEGTTDRASEPADEQDKVPDPDFEGGEGSEGAPPREEERPPREPVCETVETGVNRCVPQVSECASDADCLEDWTCMMPPVIGVGTIPEPDCPPDEDCGGSDGSDGFAPPVEEEASGTCVPDDFYDWAGASGFTGTPVDGNAETDTATKGGSDHKSTGGIFGCSGAPASTPWLIFLMLIPFFLIRKVREV